MINKTLVLEVKDFLDSGNQTFLETLISMDRCDIQGQAVIRYLLQLKHWPFTTESRYSDAIEHLFADFPERVLRDPSEYQEITAKMILDAFGYECKTVEPDPEPVENDEQLAEKEYKKPRKSKTNKEGESGSKTFKNLANIDTSEASERLKKIINIQRGND